MNLDPKSEATSLAARGVGIYRRSASPLLDALLRTAGDRMLCPMILTRAIAIATAIVAASCGPAATEAKFDSPNPAARLYAIEKAARTGDITATARIVEQLDSDDPAVRMYAIVTLQRLTGKTYGYRYFDPPYMRHEAIQRWVDAVHSGTVTDTTGTTGHLVDDDG